MLHSGLKKRPPNASPRIVVSFQLREKLSRQVRCAPSHRAHSQISPQRPRPSTFSRWPPVIEAPGTGGTQTRNYIPSPAGTVQASAVRLRVIALTRNPCTPTPSLNGQRPAHSAAGRQ